MENLTPDRFDSADAFKDWYCKNSGITVAEYDVRFVVLPCNCDCPDCRGFATVRNKPDCIQLHNMVYNKG